MSEEIDIRMEAIRLKNEELEKKHKEILEDELEAKKQGAIVSTKMEKPASTESKHRYDDVDLDFDVKDEHKQHSKNPNYKPKNVRKPMDKKHLDEIPPDPVNFLREDVAGDGSEPRPPQPQQHNNNKNRRPRGPPRGNQHNQGERSEAQSNNPDGRPRPQRPRPQNNNRQVQDSQNSQSPRKIHPQQLRTERRAVPSDDTKAADDQLAANNEGSNEKSPPTSANANRPKRPIQKRSNKQDGNNERNNLTVQITDEVRSVKIKQPERVGSGRVGHNIQADNVESPEKPQSGGDRNRKPNPRNRRNFKPKSQPNPEFQHPILEKIVISKTSVQERILRSQMSDDAAPKVVNDASHETPEIIESSK